MKTENPVKACYPNGVCPDCLEEIPDTVVAGDSCKNCGHTFWLEKEDDSPPVIAKAP
jgi:uncharacterized protein (DUF983 family)